MTLYSFFITEEIVADDSEQYTDLQKERELNPYEGLSIYSN